MGVFLNITNFLESRIEDGKEFQFEYTNKQGNKRIYIAEKAIELSGNKRTVKILLGNKEFNFTLSIMNKVELIEINPMQNDNFRNSKILENRSNIYDYLLDITKMLIRKNEEAKGAEASKGLNYSLNYIKDEILIKSKRTFNKKVLKKYLTGESAKKLLKEEPEIILPFSSNLSQKKAIMNARMFDLSVIQGPPGTGKTQTILNIICNSVFNNEKVLVVSNNNSAIDNVAEKLNDLKELFNFSIRLGSNDPYIKSFMEEIESKLQSDKKQIVLSNDVEDEVDLAELRKIIIKNEEKLELLMEQQNILNELRTQKRHIDKKLKTYGEEKTVITVNRFFLFPSQLKHEIQFLRKQRTKPSNLLSRAYFRLRFSAPSIDIENYTLYQWRLEKLYAIKMINYLENKTSEIAFVKERLKDYYEQYKVESVKQVNKVIAKAFDNRKAEIDSVLDCLKSDQIKFSDIKKEILDIYPVVLTTLDSVPSNVGYRKYDMVIVDEASQANIVTMLPTLNTATQIVIVGDSKQLSHIVGTEMQKYDHELVKRYNLNESYHFSKTNFLDSLMQVCQPPLVLLKEHYRCDFNIINYCNKKFYDGELCVYSKKASKNSLKLMPLNKEKNSDKGRRKKGGNSYFNKIEEREIVNYLKDNMERTSVITPYGKQEENLIVALPDMEERIGTIYKFQGRENKRILFSTVLTKEREHLNSVDLLGNETINVAVSRAEEELILFTHDKFFKDENHGVKDLIEYIETYGSTLESNVNSIFAYLYKQLPYYKNDKGYDSLWEKKLYEVIEKILSDYSGFSVQMKLPIADIARDQEYLNSNNDLKKFALNKNAHLDFTIISELTNKPVLVIELDGKHHKETEQMQRDIKKDKILAHHKIPIWRIRSTDALEMKDVSDTLHNYISSHQLEENLNNFLYENNWKVN